MIRCYVYRHARVRIFCNDLNADIAMIFMVILSTDATQDGYVAFGRKRTQSRDKYMIESGKQVILST